MAAPNLKMPGGDYFRMTPVTTSIIAIWVISFFAGVIQAPLNAFLEFIPGVMPQGITGLITYPLVMAPDIIGLLITGLVFYIFASQLERDWGSTTFLLFLLAVNLVALLVWEVGALLFLGRLTPLATPWLMDSSVLVAWAFLNPGATILLAFVFPVQARWVGILTIVVLYFTFPPPIGAAQLLLGFFALGGPALAYGYVWWRRTWGWIPRRRREQPRPTARTLHHPASGPFAFLTRPFREWQRRRRVAALEKTFRFGDDDR